MDMTALISEFNASTLQMVLIVTDNPESAKLWASLFREKGCKVVIETPAYAIQTGRSLSPRLVLVDAQISHVERLALCRGLKSVGRGALLVLIPSSQQEMAEAYAAGADECIIQSMNPVLVLVKAMSWMMRQQILRVDDFSLEVFA
jgi:CheY-like chemotaxis protein